NHQTVNYDTMYGSYDAEVFAAYYTTTDFDYIQTDFASDEEYMRFLNEVEQKSEIEADFDVSGDDEIVTLSTCDYTLDPDEGRLIVHAKIVNKQYKTCRCLLYKSFSMQRLNVPISKLFMKCCSVYSTFFILVKSQFLSYLIESSYNTIIMVL